MVFLRCEVLNEIGDVSSIEERQELFGELDVDGSGALDFEEYLTLIFQLSQVDTSNTTLGLTVHSGTEKTKKLRRLSVIQQIDHGLF